MSEIDAVLLIDANKYLDLYRTDKGRKLLAPLSEQASHIFVTQQIVDEVQRNKLRAAADFLRTKSQGMKLHGINVPDHFSGSESGKNQEILGQMKDINRSVVAVNAEIDTHTHEIMTQVAESKDEVSKALAPIFSEAVQATCDEMKRARERKETGNPPGKASDPLGDEITWEQVLSHFEGKRRLWIISRDGDYGTAFGGSFFLNSFLRSEIDKIANEFIVHIFEDLVEGLTHFVETTKVDATIKLSPEEITEIETEERSLPPVDSSRYSSTSIQSEFSLAELERIKEAMAPSAEMQRVMEAMQPTAEMQQVMEAMKPTAEVQQVMEAIKPSAEMQRFTEGMKPTAEMQRVMEAMKPSVEMQRVMEAMKPTAEMQRVLEAMQNIDSMQRSVNALKPSVQKPKDEDE
ncbi:PIN domain-containing protein [Halomonas sabkhae]|uniref:PIN domain-containing protein n=1 Tax=Halomonas sabkhae TaxID=626223 RepID=UPI0025B36666|nr:PIN domain-containing protein [Halomonas sabkhae]MDN3524664.1 PIN domain-containing protein [Halomonas sabkhae]